MDFLPEWVLPFIPRPTWEGTAIVAVYMCAHLLLSLLVPGRYHLGTAASDGRRYWFKLNAFAEVCVLLFIFYVLSWRMRLFSPTIVYDHYGGIFCGMNFAALLLAVWLHFEAWFIKGEWKFESVSQCLSDFFFGAQLMPYAFGLNVKLFWLRPSMMGWLLVNLSMLAKHIEVNGGEISTPMALFQVFTAFYIFDYFFVEEAMTSTWDIIAEHFGLMLIWGDIVFIPFVFSIQSWYLIDNQLEISTFRAFCCVALFFVGYLVFRGANYQKHIVKTHTHPLIWGEKPEYIGGRLLVSGWWGWSRKPNYVGDLLLAASYSSMIGFADSSAIFAYAYVIYLFILLLHREHRDHQRCAAKYKSLWVEYCNRVPYHIFPYIY